VYENPPVVEAIARLEFASPVEWDVTVPGQLFEQLKSHYPVRPATRQEMQAQFGFGEQQTQGAPPNMEFRTGAASLVFSTAEQNRQLIIGPGSLSAHGMAPYEGWESLESRLLAGLGALRQCVEVVPEFASIAVRYINRVELPAPKFSFEDYLTVAINMPGGFPSTMVGFLERIESVYPDQSTKLAFTFASTDSEPGTFAFILDFDLTHRPEGEQTDDQLKDLLTQLKANETNAFESLLQDSLRELFNEISD